MRRLALLAFLSLLALPAAASAAPATIAPRAAAVTAAGATSVEVANPNRHALTGRVTLAVGARAAATRSVRLARRSVTVVRLRLDPTALAALRASGRQRATVTARLRRAGGRATTVRRTLTLRAAGGAAAPAPAPSPRPAPGPAPGGSGTPATPAPTPPAPSNRWVGRMGAEGAYDDLELTLVDGRIQFTKAPIVPVFCFETGGGRGDWTSGELFDAPGPWTVGADASIDRQGVSVNPLVGRSPRTITYKVSGTSQANGKLTGTLGMIFYAARPDVFTGAMTIVNCAGSESFEAVPA